MSIINHSRRSGRDLRLLQLPEPELLAGVLDAADHLVPGIRRVQPGTLGNPGTGAHFPGRGAQPLDHPGTRRHNRLLGLPDR